MDSLLFISKSTLSHNLLKAIRSLIALKGAILMFEDSSEIGTLPQKGPLFERVLIDWNVLENVRDQNQLLSLLHTHPRLKKAPKILIHDRAATIPEEFLKKYGFKKIFAKPFLPEELAEIAWGKIGDGIR